jgi:hypothetical protein
VKLKIINWGYLIKKALFVDIVDRYLLIASLFLFLTNYLIWRHWFLSGMYPIFLRVNIYPVKYLAIVIALNTLLSISAYEKEKEVGYVLLMGNIIVGLLCFTLEIFYLTHLS